MIPANDSGLEAAAAVVAFAWSVARRHRDELARTWAALYLAELLAAGVVRLEPRARRAA